MKKILISALVTLFLALFSLSAAANDENDEDLWDDDYGWEGKFSVKSPCVKLLFGMGEPAIDKDAFSGKFAKISAATIRMGMAEEEDYMLDGDIIDYDFTYLFLENSSAEWMDEASANEIETKTWTFGLGNADGYGYKLGENSDIVLYRSGAIIWSKSDFVYEDDAMESKDISKMDYIGDGFRFGDFYESGVKIKIYKPLAISAGYKRTVVFPRHLFWYWAGSDLLRKIGDVLLGEFTDEIFKASPYAGPIVDFVLRSAYNMGFYELRKNDMNWPISTDEPLMFDGYNIGLSFAF